MAASTATELHAVAAVNERLQTALKHARSIKQAATVNPPIPQSSLEGVVNDLTVDIDDTSDQSYKFAAVETAARNIFYSLIKSSTIEQPEFVGVWDLLDVLLVGGNTGKCAPELVVWLIEELLDSQTTDGCRKVFDYLESRRERLAQKDFHKKNLVFLRSCNELLRRLSRAEDASFCGRVFFFLFQTFPLGDKSSVNLRGEFHVENTTSFDETEISSNEPVSITNESVEGTSTPAPITVPTKPAVKATTKRKQAEEEVIDNAALYPIFWRLQQCFSVPTKLFRPAEFTAFKAALSATIAKFKKTPSVSQTAATQRRKQLKRKHDELDDDENLDFAENYNPKYLTSRDLFDLELSDQAFQRHILVQALILLDFLLSLTEKTKKKLSTIEHPNKSLLYDFTLNAEDAKWALDTTNVITEFFKITPEGRFYDRMVNTILIRDRNWVRWKVESCPSIVRSAMTTEEILETRSKLQRSTRPRRVDARAMGAMDLDFLEDDQSGGLESLRQPERYTAPSMDQLLGGISTHKLDLEMSMLDDETASLNNMIQNKSWRLLRHARASQVATLNRWEYGKDLEEVLRPKTIDESSAVEATA